MKRLVVEYRLCGVGPYWHAEVLGTCYQADGFTLISVLENLNRQMLEGRDDPA